MAQLGETALMVGAPEVGIPMEIGKQLAPHAPTILMIPLVAFSILLILIGIIVFSTDHTSKTPGALLLLLGFMVGGGAFLIMYKTESSKKK
jgi:drug/metabolite transporter (DMT)-like permease